MKPSEYVEKYLDSHTIYTEPDLSKDFEKKTGIEAPWGTHTVQHANSSYGKFKGVQRPLEGPPSQPVSYGWEIVEGLVEALAPDVVVPDMNGRGSRFRVALKALREAGQ